MGAEFGETAFESRARDKAKARSSYSKRAHRAPAARSNVGRPSSWRTWHNCAPTLGASRIQLPARQSCPESIGPQMRIACKHRRRQMSANRHNLVLAQVREFE